MNLRISALLAVGALAMGCSGDAVEEVTSATVPIPGVPADARTAVGSGQPRSPGYWQSWSTCGPDSRAATAAANGGPDAGWYLVDDLLGSPPIEIGGFPIGDCQTALAVLVQRDARSFDGLAAHLLATELSRTSGAETCSVADQARRAAQVILEQQGYDGPGTVEVTFDADAATILDLLAAYGTGDLCV